MELRSVGFTIADGVAGPFQLDVAWIALVAQVCVRLPMCVVSCVSCVSCVLCVCVYCVVVLAVVCVLRLFVRLCVLHMKPIFLPTDIAQHILCPCRLCVLTRHT